MNLLLAALFILSLMYAAFITWCIAGWKKIKKFSVSPHDFMTGVSVIIPARNEEKNISACLEDILSQQYPVDLFEILVVDDDSDDHTSERVNEMISRFPGHRISLLKNQTGPKGLRFKKQAITTGIHHAIGELIVTTDADCRMGKDWLAAIVSYYELNQPSMIAGPVCFYEEKNFLEKLQSLEFIGLIGIGAASVSNGLPLMCNGANLAYTKKIFMEVNGFDGDHGTASGDDTQLLQKVSKINPSGIHFIKSQDAVVYTHAMNSLKELFQQRKRWVSKIPAKMGLLARLAGSVAWLVHAGLLAAFVSSIFNPSVVPVLFILLLVKCLPEFIFLWSISVFFSRRPLLWLFLPAQLIYLVYVTVIGAVSPIGSYRWKEREMKSMAAGMPVS